MNTEPGLLAEIRKQLEQIKAERPYMRIVVHNRMSGEREEHIIGRGELEEFLDEVASRNPLGRYKVYHTMPCVYDIGPFAVVVYGGVKE